MIKIIFILFLNTFYLFSQFELSHDSIKVFKTYYGTKENPYYSYNVMPFFNKNDNTIFITSNFLIVKDSLNYRPGLLSGFESVLYHPISLAKGDTFNIEFFISTFEKAKDSLYIYYETTSFESNLVYRDSVKIYFEALEKAKLKIDYSFQEQYMYKSEADSGSYFTGNYKIHNYGEDVEIIRIDSTKSNVFKFVGFYEIDFHPPKNDIKIPITLRKDSLIYVSIRDSMISYGQTKDSLKIVFKDIKTKLIDSNYVLLYKNIIKNNSLDVQKNNFIYRSNTNFTYKYPNAINIYNRFEKDIKIKKFTYDFPIESNSLDLKMYNKNLPVIIKPNGVDTIEIDFTPKNIEGQLIGRLNIEYEYDGVLDNYFIFIVTQNDSKTNIELTYENPLAFYPNPATSYATLLLNEEPQVGEQVQIYNSLGILVSAFEVLGKQTQVNTEKFEDGIYLARLLHSGKSAKFSVMR